MVTPQPIPITSAPDPAAERLDRVFFALSDPVRRAILGRLDQGPLLVSEIAAPFEISLQAISRHIQVLVRAGLISQGANRAHQPLQPGRGAAVRGRRLDQPLRQILAGPVRDSG